MKTLNKEMIKKLAKGEIGLQNTAGTLDELREVLKAAVPDDKTIPGGEGKYYCIKNDEWRVTNEKKYDISYPISAFYEQKTKSFPRWMYINNTDDINGAKKRYILAFFNGKYWAVNYASYENELLDKYKATGWQFAWELDEVPPQKETITIEVTQDQKKLIQKILEHEKVE